jgi:two-component system LytT family sensor kinase
MRPNHKWLSANPAMRPILVVWGFGYLLVEIVAFLTGRTSIIGGLYTSAPLWVCAVLLSYALHRLWRSPAVPRLARLVVLLAGLMLVTCIQTIIDLYLHYLISLTLRPEWATWAADFAPRRVFAVALLYLWSFCLAETLLWAGSLGENARLQQQRADALAVAGQRAEAAALRLQLNPHFLFNTLNGIAALVVTGRKERANDMLGLLADFLRASLAADPAADIRLDEEIATISTYVAIEAERIGDAMTFRADVDDEAAAALVPPFIIQPLVENAIKHGADHGAGLLTIVVTASLSDDMLCVAVVNRSEKAASRFLQKRAGRGGASIGLANVRQRLSLAYGPCAALSTTAAADGFTAEFSIPFRSARVEERLAG